MRIYKTKWFTKWAKKEGLDDSVLACAIAEMHDGLVDADLGGHVYKKRVTLAGRGKRGSLRTLLAFKLDDKAFFLYGFAKNQQANVSDKELKALKLLAQAYFGYNDKALKKAQCAGELKEVENNE